MGTKYYVETSEDNGEYGYQYEVFQHDKPFSSIEDAKVWADKDTDRLGFNAFATIYECSDNIIRPILDNSRGWQTILSQTAN